MQDTHVLLNKEKLKLTHVLRLFSQEFPQNLTICFKYKISPLETNGIAFILNLLGFQLDLYSFFYTLEL